MVNWYFTPAQIVHENKPDRMYAMDTVHLAVRKLHLGWEVERLMLYYSQCSNGFRPALELISKEARIHKSHICSVRQTLNQYGFITYDKDERVITVHWDRIKLYATLDASLTKVKKKENLIIAPVNNNEESLTLKEASKKYKLVHPRDLSPNQKRFYNAVGNMTAKDWTEILIGMGKKIGKPLNLSDDESKHYDLDPVDGVHPYTDLSEMPWSGELPVVVTKKLPF